MEPRLPVRRRWATVAAVSVLLGLQAFAGLAMTRDVEVTDVGAEDGILAMAPPVAMFTDVDALSTWAVALTNGAAEPIDLDLAVVVTEPTSDGFAAGDTGVPWAVLPRDTVHLAPGHRADLTLALTPSADDLPAAITLVASAAGDPTVQVEATAVLWAAGEVPEVSLDVSTAGITVTSNGPVVLDLAVRTVAPPRRSRDTPVGPLVVLAGQARTVAQDVPANLLGTSTDVVAAVNGVEVARASASTGPSVPGLVLAVAAVALIAVNAVLLLRRRAPPETLPAPPEGGAG